MRHFGLDSVVCLFASVQLALSATIEVTVGGPGVLKYDPPSVVCTYTRQQKKSTSQFYDIRTRM